MPTTMVAITIDDSGIGMEKDFVDNHVFKPFAKANVHAVGWLELSWQKVAPRMRR